jgi:tetratricopeptide (TPR) repeat protein
MKRSIGFTVLLAAALFVAAPASALSVTSDTDAQAHVERGDQLFQKGDYAAALVEYTAAAKLVRQEGEVPAKELRRIANTQYYDGRYQSAGHTLEKLAEEAAEYGDIVTEAWAIADAAWVAAIAGDKIDADRRVARLERLLTSPYMPDDEVEKLRTNRLGDYSANTVALIR